MASQRVSTKQFDDSTFSSSEQTSTVTVSSAKVSKRVHRRLQYTNHILQRLQELLFGSSFGSDMAELFLSLNKVHIDTNTGKFSIFDKINKVWKVYTRSYLYPAFSASITTFIQQLIIALTDYKATVSQGQWRYSELFTTDILATTTEVDGVTMKSWGYWNEAVKWEANLFDTLNFVVEDVEDPTVNRFLLPGTTQLTDHLDQKELATRYMHRYTYLFNRNNIRKSGGSVNVAKLATLQDRIDNQINQLQYLSDRMTKGSTSTRSQVIDAILVSPYLLSEDELVSNSYYLLGTANQQVLDLASWMIYNRNADDNLFASCERHCGDGDSSSSVTDQHIEGVGYVGNDASVIADMFDDDETYQKFMTMVGLALLCPPEPDRHLFIITCLDSNSRGQLKQLLAAALTGVYHEADAKFLHKSKIQLDDLEPFKEYRFVLFDASQLQHNVSDELFRVYFSPDNQLVVGGKHYFFNTSFIIISSEMPRISVANLENYKNIYYLNIDRLCCKQCDKNELRRLHQALFVSLTISASDCYQQLQQSSIILPPLPLQTNKTATRNNTVADENVYRKQLFSEFIDRRVEFDPNYKQLAYDFRSNFNTYLMEEKGMSAVDVNTSFKECSIGKLLSASYNRQGLKMETRKKENRDGKMDRIYLGVRSYDYDLN